jgi:hypothetical protein
MGTLDEVISAVLRPTSRAEQAPTNARLVNFNSLKFAAALGWRPRAAAGQGSMGQQNRSGGLVALIEQFSKSGLQDIMKSWIGRCLGTHPPGLVRTSVHLNHFLLRALHFHDYFDCVVKCPTSAISLRRI